MPEENTMQLNPNVQIIETPTGRLRWRRGVLQQEWHVVRREAARESALLEYRDVPTDDE